MSLLAAASPAALPSIDLGLGSLPVYALLFVFAFGTILFLRRFLRDRSFRKHRLSFAVALGALVAAFVVAAASDGLHVFGSAFSWTLLGAFLVVSLLLQQFRRSFGTAFALLVAAFIVVVILFLRSLTAFTGRTMIAQIHTASLETNTMSLLVEPQPGVIPGQDKPFTMVLPGERFGLIVYQIVFDDLAVFFGAKTRFAWLGMMAFGTNFQQTAVRLFPDGFGRKSVFEKLEKRELALPFVKSVQADIPTKLAVAGKSFSVWIENDGGVTIQAQQRPAD